MNNPKRDSRDIKKAVPIMGNRNNTEHNSL